MNEEQNMDGVMRKKKIAVFANGWGIEYLELVLEGIRRKAKLDEVDIFVFTTFILWDVGELQNKAQLNMYHLPKPEDYDGAIVLANTFNMPDEQERVCSLFERKGIPLVSTEVKVPGMAYVGTDNQKGMEELTEHLVTVHGVKDIVYVSGVENHPECALRKKTVEETLARHGLHIRDDIRGYFGFYDAERAVKRFFDAGNKVPQAFVCANDLMALGVVGVLHARGYRVPEDVIVTGYDDIHEAKASYPIIATVSRGWDKLGEYAYEELKNQVRSQDPSVEREYASRFIPSESCGCTPDPETVAYRMNKMRNTYVDQTRRDMQNIAMQKLRIAVAQTDTREEFHRVAAQEFEKNDFFGDDFCICTNPWFFDDDEENFPKRLRGYSETMDVLYEKRSGRSAPLRTFSTQDLYPGYKKEQGKTNVYIFAPLNNNEMIIGYLCVKNNLSIIYNLTFRRLQSELNSMFVSIRQYIYSQNINRQLREVYMTDFLTEMYNRTGCEKVLFSFIESEKRVGRSVALLFVDIDYMKVINDRFGHLNGDLAIKATAEAMRKALTEEWLFGRYGGDEFVAVGPCADEGIAEDIRNSIAGSISTTIESLGLAFPLSVSVGLTIIHPKDGGDISEYVRMADESMYEEKEKAHELIMEKLAE